MAIEKEKREGPARALGKERKNEGYGKVDGENERRAAFWSATSMKI